MVGGRGSLIIAAPGKVQAPRHVFDDTTVVSRHLLGPELLSHSAFRVLMFVSQIIPRVLIST
jgi:hypothetical protein